MRELGSRREEEVKEEEEQEEEQPSIYQRLGWDTTDLDDIDVL